MRRSCCSSERICTPCCLPRHNLKIDVVYEAAAMFFPTSPPPWIFNFSLDLVYLSSVPGQPSYSASVPRESVWFEWYAQGATLPPGSYPPSGGTPYPPSEGFRLNCQSDAITITTIRTIGPFSSPEGGGFWSNVGTASLLYQTDDSPGIQCFFYIEEMSCDPISIKCKSDLKNATTVGCALGVWDSFGIIREIHITDPNWGGNTDCETPSGGTIYFPMSACAPDLSGVNFSILDNLDNSTIATGTSDSTGYSGFDVSWNLYPFGNTWTSDNPPFRNLLPSADSRRIPIDPNIIFNNYVFSFSVPSGYTCIPKPTHVITRNTLYLTDSVLGSTTLTHDANSRNWEGTLTAVLDSSYTRPDGIVCPLREFTVWFVLLGDTGNLSIRLCVDANYCPAVNVAPNTFVETQIPYIADLSMIDSDIVMFRANHDWSSAASQSQFGGAFMYAYMGLVADYIISE